VQGVCYLINKIPKFIKKKVYVQNSDSILRVKGYVSNCGVTAMIFIRMCYRGSDGHCLRHFRIYIIF
jgi:hypothetical protein